MNNLYIIDKMLFNKNKKGIVFWPGLLIFTSLLFLLFLIYLINPNQNSLYNFGNKTLETEKLALESYSKENYLSIYKDFLEYNLKKDIKNRSFIKTDRKFLSDYLEYDSSIFSDDFKEKLTKSKVKINNKDYYLWINEKEKINFYESLINEDYIEFYLNHSLETFNEDFEKQFLYYNSDLNIECSVENFSINCEIKDNFLDESSEGVFINSELKEKISLNYSEFIFGYLDMKDNLKSLMEKSRIYISNCFAEKTGMANKDEFYDTCYTEGYNEALKELNLDQKYSIKVDWIEIDPGELNNYGLGDDILESDNYNLLNFKVLNKKNDEEISFNLLLEENIPPMPIKFEVMNVEKEDKKIKVKFEEPLDIENINYFIILLSEKDFTNDKKLIDSLNNNKIPDKVELESCETEFDSKINYNFLPTSEINILVAHKKDINAIKGNDNNYYSLEIDGICKKNSDGKYEVQNFEEKEIYVYVFATDINNNFYPQNLKEKTKVIVPKDLEGPKPIFLEESSIKKIAKIIPYFGSVKKEVKGDFDDLDKTISIKIEGYNDEDFDHYVALISPISDFDYKKCFLKELPFCYTYNLPKGMKDLNLAITSNQFLLNQNPTNPTIRSFRESKNLIINSNFFESQNSRLILENKKYYVILIPVNSENIGLFDRFYETEDGENILHIPKEVEVKNNLPPHPLNSINKPTIVYSNGRFVFSNYKKDDSVKGLKIIGTITIDGQVKDFVGIVNGPIMDFSTVNLDSLLVGVANIQFVANKIVPFGKGGELDNYLDKNYAYNGGFYSESITVTN